MGLLDSSSSLADIQSLLSQFQPTDADQSAARRSAMLAMGLGLLGSRRGYELGDIGKAGLMGMQTYQNQLSSAPKLRMENLKSAIDMRGLLQNMNLDDMITKALGNVNQPPGMVAGPPQPFQQPGGAGALMDGAMSGGAGPSPLAASFAGNAPGNAPPPQVSLPTQIPGQQDPNALRETLAKIGLLQGMKKGDITAANKFMFPDPIVSRAGAPLVDPRTGQPINPNPKPPDGAYYDPKTDSYVWPKNALGVKAQAEALPHAVGLAFEKPTEQVLPGGGTGLPPGSALDQRFGGGALPYGAPAPFPNAPQPQAQAQPPQPVVPRAPIQTKQSPEQEANSRALGEEAASSRAAASQSTKALGELGQIKQTLDYLKPGPTLPFRAGVAGYAQEIPGVGRSIADTLVPNSATALPAIAAINKLTVGLTAEQSKVFGSREGQQVIGMIKSAQVHAGMVPGAPEVLLDSAMGIHKWFIAHDAAREAWLSDPQHNGSAAGFEQDWDHNQPLSSFIPDMPALKNLSEGKAPGASREQSQQQAPQQQQMAAPRLTAAGQGNATVKSILSRNPSPQQIEALRAKGYLQ